MKAWRDEETGRIVIFTGEHADADLAHFVSHQSRPRKIAWLGLASVALSIFVWVAVVLALVAFATRQ